jgi:hypothetical protein
MCELLGDGITEVEKLVLKVVEIKFDEFIQYIEFLFGSFIKGWWAAFTGAASILSWFAFPDKDITINKLWVSISILIFSTVIFLCISIFLQSWKLFTGEYIKKIKVDGLLRGDEIDKKHIFLLNSASGIPIGSLMEVYGIKNQLEVPVALIEVDHRRDDGITQANALWISPIHLLDIKKGNFSTSSLKVHNYIGKKFIDRWIDEDFERKDKTIWRV